MKQEESKMIKAIETRWNGYRFRSRLEARWAVFFEDLGTPWEYEPEGFDLGADGLYLPDFYLQDIDAWVEIKPQRLSDAERDKAFALSSMTNKIVVELNGIPDPNALGPYGCYVEGRAHVGKDMDGAAENYFVEYLIKFYKDQTGSTISVSDPDALSEALAFDTEYYRKRYGREHPTHFANGMVITHHGLSSKYFSSSTAAKAARSARFEHGEKPTIRKA